MRVGLGLIALVVVLVINITNCYIDLFVAP